MSGRGLKACMVHDNLPLCSDSYRVSVDHAMSMELE